MNDELTKACQQAVELQEQAKAQAMAQLAGFTPSPSPLKENGKTVPVPPPTMEAPSGDLDEISLTAKQAINAGAINSLQDKDMQDKIKSTSRGFLEHKINSIGNQLTKEEQESAYDVNAEACDNVGINRGSEKWAIGCAKISDRFWKAVWLTVSFFTVTPINNFAKGLKKFFKNSWLIIILSIIIWLAIVTAPVWIVWLTRR